MKKLLTFILAINMGLPAAVFANENNGTSIDGIIAIAQNHPENLTTQQKKELLDAANKNLSGIRNRLEKTSKKIANGDVEVETGLTLAIISGFSAAGSAYIMLGMLTFNREVELSPLRSNVALTFWGSLAAFVVGVAVGSHGDTKVSMSQAEYDSLNQSLTREQAAFDRLSQILSQRNQ